MESLFTEFGLISQNAWTIRSKAFWSVSLHIHNSSLEGATELKFAPFCSSWGALSDGIVVYQIRFDQILAKRMDYTM